MGADNTALKKSITKNIMRGSAELTYIKRDSAESTYFDNDNRDGVDDVILSEPVLRVLAQPSYNDGRKRASRVIKRVTICAAILLPIAFLMYILLDWYPSYQARLAEIRRVEQWRKEEAQHPFNYRAVIENNAVAFGLDPALVASIVLNESSYNPRAVSRLGALGLMQLMPETAKWVAGKLGEEYSEEKMYEPETNVRFGCWFLAYLNGKFDGDATKMAAAYHAGAGRVEEWLSNPEYATDGELVVIPYDDTSWYVEKVIKAYDVYTRHYYEVAANADGA